MIILKNTIYSRINQAGGGGGGFSNTKSLAFDGVDETVSLGNISDLNGLTSASFSMWLKVNSTGIEGIMNQWGGSSDRLIYAFIWLANGRIDIYISGYRSFNVNSNAIISALSTGQWFNLVITYDGSQAAYADRVKVYIDNQELTGNISFAPTSLNNSTTDFILGTYPSGTYLDGNIDEFAIFTNTLTTDNINDIYNGGPNDLTSLSPVLWYRMGDNSTFKSPQILMPENTNKDKVSNYSLTFDGVDDVINFGTDTSLRPTTALALSFWLNGTGSGDDFVFRNGADGGLSNNFGFGFRVLSGANDYRFVLGDGSSNTVLLVMGVLSGWNHFLCNWDGTTMELFINGLSVGTTAFAGPISYSTGNFLIGDRNTSPSKPYLGLIDEVAIWNSDQSANVSSIYNGGEPTTITGATAYWKLGEQATFSTNWLVPNSALSNYSKYSFNFDGVDDYIGIGTTSLGVTSAITVSAWVKTTSTGAYKVICAEDASGGANRNWSLILASNDKVGWFVWNTDGSVTVFYRATANEITDGNWHHVMGTYDGTSNADGLKLYVDGNVETATAGSTGIRSTSGVAPSIGSLEGGAGWFWNGNIDEVAVWDSVQDVSSIYNSGTPTTISGALSHWQMGEDATYNSSTSQWTIPDQIGSNDGTSSNTMALDTLVGEAPNYFGGGVSDAMTIEDRVGDASNSSNNAVSYNMEAEDIDNNTP